MHKARAFFFVAAGVFLLALAYHLGVQSATAQGAGQVTAVWPDGGLSVTPDLVATSTGDVYYGTHDPFASPGTWTLAGHIPSSAPVVCIKKTGSNPNGLEYAVAYDAAGGYFTSSDYGATWVPRGNVFGAPTPATQATWGQVKAKYRPGASQDK